MIANEIESIKEQLHTATASADSYELQDQLEARRQELIEAKADVASAKAAVFPGKTKKRKKPQKSVKTKVKHAWKAAKDLGLALVMYHAHNSDD